MTCLHHVPHGAFPSFHVKHQRTVLTVLKGQFCEEKSNVVSFICVFTATNKGVTLVKSDSTFATRSSFLIVFFLQLTKTAQLGDWIEL